MLPTDPLPQPEKSISPVVLVRFSFGVLLLLLGLSLGGWVLGQVFRLLDDPGMFKAFQELALPPTTNAEVILLPREVWLYGLPIALLSIAGSLAGSLITNGATLLSGNFEQLQRTVTQKLEEVQAQLQKVVSQLNLPRS